MLDDLITKIIGDCKEEANRIIDEAEAAVSALYRKNGEEAEAEKRRILQEAAREAQSTAEYILSQKKIEARDAVLFARGEIINKVLDRAVERLNGLPRDGFIGFLRENLPAIAKDGGEIILPGKYSVTSDELFEITNVNIVVYSGERRINGGFIFIIDGIEYNRTFEALVKYYRHELENEIIKELI